MSERPFMQLYVSDFIGDTLHLSTEQIGAYMLLLMAMWNAGGKLPADDRKLARVTRLSVRKWKAISGDLMTFFSGDEGHIWHNRLTKELKKSESKSELRASAGAKGGAAKALKDKEARLAKAMRMPQHLPDTIQSNEDANASSSPEPDKSAPVAARLPVTSGPDFEILETDVAEWREAFPALDIRQQLNAMRAWLNANPTRRKTRRGVKRFVVSWLNKEQNRSRAPHPRQGQPPPREDGFAKALREDLERERMKRHDPPDHETTGYLDAGVTGTDQSGAHVVDIFAAPSLRR